MRRCGICRGTGHNRQTCQKNTMRVSSPSVSQTIVTNNTETTARTASGRRKPSCSYCKQKFYKVDRTHTSTTCLNRKNDLAAWIVSNKEWAKNHKKDMVNRGYGIGAIVEHTNGQTYVIERIDFQNLSQASWRAYIASQLDGPENKFYYYRSAMSFPRDDENNSVTVVSAIPGHIVASQFPKDWESGTYGIPRRLGKRRRRK